MEREISKMLSHGDMDTQGLFNSRRFRDNGIRVGVKLSYCL